MKKQNSFKRSLIASVVALCLCVSSLIGTTFAWFTDSVTSSGNVIQTGTLDVAMGWSEATADPETATYKDAAEGAIFYNEYWEPGYVEARHIKISNQGTLALKYKLVIVAEGEVSDLSDVIDVYYYDPAEKVAERDELAGAKKIGTLTDVLKNFETTAQGNLKKGEDHTVTIALKMQESAGNEYQNKSIGTSFSIVLVATQLTSEDDSYGNDYDGRAEFPEADVGVHDGESKVELEAGDKISVELPAAAEKGNYTLIASDPVLGTTEDEKTIVEVDITLLKDGEKVSDDGSTVYTVEIEIGEGKLVSKVLHNGEEVTDYLYSNGIVSFETLSFSPFAVIYEDVTPATDILGEDANTFIIEDYADLCFFRDSVNAGNTYKGMLVKLANDINLSNTNWTPIGNSTNNFKGTFDGNGKTISNLKVIMPGKSNMGLFGMTTDGEVKNLTIENAEIVGRLNVGVVAGTPYTTKYTNIKVVGHVEVTGMAYVGGVGGKNAYADWNNITVNVDETSFVNANSVENGIAYRTYVGGVIGFMGEGGHKVSNVTSNIDVYGSTCDVGGIVGIAHYNNKFENITCTGDVTIYNAAEEADAKEIGGIAGVWHNENGTTVTFTNCKFEGKLASNIEGLDLSSYAIAGAPYSKNGTGVLIIDGVETVFAGTAAALKWALDNGKNVTLANDIALDVNGKAMIVGAGADIIIDLNGNDIIGTTTVSGASQVLFEVKGELTVIGDGTIALHDKSGAAFNQSYENAAIYVNGGVANLDDGMIVCTSSGEAMAYAADAVGGNSVINVNGATLYSSYIGIRSFPTTSGKTNTINYNSGVVYGGKNGYDIWTQEGNGTSLVNVADVIGYTHEDRWGGMYYVNDDVAYVSTTAALQAALDSATDGDTIILVPGASFGTVYMGRPTKNNDTTMTCDTHSYSTTSAEDYKAHLDDGAWHTTPQYTTILKNLTVIGAEGATVEGLVATSGHNYGDVYDYVRDKDYDVGSAYYSTLIINNVVFKNVNFTGTVNINTSDATSVYDGVTFDGCSFTTGGTSSTNGPAIRYYNEANNGNVKNIVVNDCTFTNCYQGVYVHHTNGITVVGSTFENTGHNAIGIQGHDGDVDLKNVVITGNIFKNIGDRVIRFNNVGADSNITIQSNVATDSGNTDGEVMKATSIATGVTTSISNNNWNGVVANEELMD